MNNSGLNNNSNSFFMTSMGINSSSVSNNGGGGGGGGNSGRHLLPSIKIKTNELFYKWLSQTDKTEQLNEVINFIRMHNKTPKYHELKSVRNVSLKSLI